MRFGTLENCSFVELVNVFNAAFADYLVPLQLSEEQLRAKFITENIHLKYSVGVWSEDCLIAFILHGIGEREGQRCLYNGGTGVLPAFRGKGLTVKMYQYFIPTLKDAGILKVYLEVLTENEAAIASYKKVGFRSERLLSCWKGKVSSLHPSLFIIDNPKETTWSEWSSWWSMQPSWQHTTDAVLRNLEKNKILCAYSEEQCVGYIVFQPISKKIIQLAVHPHYRRKGIASMLLAEGAKKWGEEWAMINVDEQAEDLMLFLNDQDFNLFVKQWEMVLEL